MDKDHFCAHSSRIWGEAGTWLTNLLGRFVQGISWSWPPSPSDRQHMSIFFLFQAAKFCQSFHNTHSLSRGSTSGVKQHTPKKMFVYNSRHTTQFEVELCDCFIMCRIQRLSLAEAMRCWIWSSLSKPSTIGFSLSKKMRLRTRPTSWYHGEFENIYYYKSR